MGMTSKEHHVKIRYATALAIATATSLSACADEAPEARAPGERSARAALSGPLGYTEQVVSPPTTATLMLGMALGADGDTFVAGSLSTSPFEYDAHVFRRGGGGGWAAEARLASPAGHAAASPDYFGQAVAVSGDRALVGASHRTFGAALNPTGANAHGAGYVFERDPATGAWSLAAELAPPTLTQGARLGFHVALDGDRALLSGDSGSVAAFSRDAGGSWGFDGALAYPPSSGANAARFGHDVAVDGDVAVVTAPNEVTTLTGYEGAAYVFARDPATGAWSDVQRLTVPTADVVGPLDLGRSVALEGDRLALGAERFTYVFERDPATGAFFLAARLQAPDASAGFGASVAVRGDAVLVGDQGNPGRAHLFRRSSTGQYNLVSTFAPAANGSSVGRDVALAGQVPLLGSFQDVTTHASSGAVYAYAPPIPASAQDTKLSLTPQNFGDFFGYSVSAAPTRIAAGALSYDASGGPNGNDGGVAIFEPDATSAWAQVALLTAGDADPNDQFGASVSMLGDRLLVGAPMDDQDGNNAGGAYVFDRDPVTGTWSESAKLRPDDPFPSRQLGYSVSLGADRALAGAPYDSKAINAAGAAYVFTRDAAGAWSQEARIPNPSNDLGDLFGWSVSLDGDRALVGAPKDDDAATDAGAAFVLERDPATGAWSQAAKLVPADGAPDEQFGYSAALRGDRALIGAIHDDERGARAGAAYLFERDPATGTWSQTTKILPTVSGPNDQFGLSVALSDDGSEALVGATFFDDVAGSFGVGVVRRFTLGAAAATQVERLDPSDGGAGDFFGRSVDFAGDTAVVGSSNHDRVRGAVYLYAEDDLAPCADPQALTTYADVPLSITLTGSDPDGDSVTLAVDQQPAHGALSGTPPNLVYTPDPGFVGADSFTVTATAGPLTSPPATIEVDVLDRPVCFEHEARLAPSTDLGFSPAGRVAGTAVAVEGNRAFVVTDTNEHYLYGRAASGSWSLTATLTGANSSSANYVVDAALLGDTAAISYRDSSVDVFTRDALLGTWSRTDTLNAGLDSNIRSRGANLALGPDRVAVGVRELVGNTRDEYVLVFARAAGAWTQEARIDSPTVDAIDFAQVVEVSGDRLAVGARFAQSNLGAVYVYGRDAAGAWTLSDTLEVPAAEPDRNLGASVALSGDLLLANATRSAGAHPDTVLAFERDPATDTWAYVDTLLKEPGPDTDFGRSIALEGDRAVVGAPRDDDLGQDIGAAYVFERDPATGAWSRFAKITLPDAAVTSRSTSPRSELGRDVALSGGRLLLGAPWAAARGSGLDDGAAYVCDIAPVNLPPVAVDDTISTDEDTPVTFDPTTNDLDFNGDTLSLVGVSGPQVAQLGVTPLGAVTFSGNDVTYTPTPDASGFDLLTYTITDGATVATGQIRVGVRPVDDAPTAQGSTVTTQEDTPAPLALTASDADGDPLTRAITQQPSHGALIGDPNTGSLTYDPDPGFTGTDSVTFTASDAASTSAPATITITVNPVDDPPTADPISLVTSAGDFVGVTLTGSDPDGDPLTFAIVQPPSSGTLTGSAPTLTYTPNAGFVGLDTFTYTANDGTSDSAPATVTINVTGSTTTTTTTGQQQTSGCATAPHERAPASSPWLLALAALALTRRRRR
jgi:hypothetical protein